MIDDSTEAHDIRVGTTLLAELRLSFDGLHSTEAVWKRVGEAVHAEGPC